MRAETGATKSAGSERASRPWARKNIVAGADHQIEQCAGPIADLIAKANRAKDGRPPRPAADGSRLFAASALAPALKLGTGDRPVIAQARRTARSAPRRLGTNQILADKTTADQPKTSQWSMLHALGGASKLQANVNDRSGASGGA